MDYRLRLLHLHPHNSLKLYLPHLRLFCDCNGCLIYSSLLFGNIGNEKQNQQNLSLYDYQQHNNQTSFAFDYTNNEYSAYVKESFASEAFFEMWVDCAEEADECCAFHMNEENVYPSMFTVSLNFNYNKIILWNVLKIGMKKLLSNKDLNPGLSRVIQ